MVTRMVGGAKAALIGAIVVVILFAVLVSMIRWGQANPAQMSALADKIAAALVAVVTWVCNIIISALS